MYIGVRYRYLHVLRTYGVNDNPFDTYGHGRSAVEPFRDMHGHDVIVEQPHCRSSEL